MNAAYLTPAITLFNEDGTLDLVSQEKLFNNLIENGVDGILVRAAPANFCHAHGPAPGDGQVAIETVDHRSSSIIGTSHMVADEIVSFSNYCLDAGADAVMILPPYYFHFGAEALLQYYDRVGPARSTAISTSTTSPTTPATPFPPRRCWPWPRSIPTSWA